MIRLKDIPTTCPGPYDKEDYEDKVKDLADEIADLQHIMYAQKKHSLLVVLQGMDASGKDGISRKVFGECSPAGIDIVAFKKPTEEEFAHDFLWRVHKHAPAKGMMMIFNRSHYEDVLIQRVHHWINERHAEKRIQAINAFEELIQFDNNTTILKFYLHLSKEQQQVELQERIDDPRKHWKYNANDWKEAKHWDDYMRCYEEVINNSVVPWHIIPMDQRWYGAYCLAQIVRKALQELDMELPGLPDEMHT